MLALVFNVTNTIGYTYGACALTLVRTPLRTALTPCLLRTPRPPSHHRAPTSSCLISSALYSQRYVLPLVPRGAASLSQQRTFRLTMCLPLAGPRRQAAVGDGHGGAGHARPDGRHRREPPQRDRVDGVPQVPRLREGECRGLLGERYCAMQAARSQVCEREREREGLKLVSWEQGWRACRTSARASWAGSGAI